MYLIMRKMFLVGVVEEGNLGILTIRNVNSVLLGSISLMIMLKIKATKKPLV
jgi:hypothetical protein